MKGPGLRIDVDVRRVWLCPSCGQTQRLPLSAASARCGCVRDGVPMKLVEESRSPRVALRTDARAVIERLMAGESIPRLVPVLSHSDGGFNDGNGTRFRPPHPTSREEPVADPPAPPAPGQVGSLTGEAPSTS